MRANKVRRGIGHFRPVFGLPKVRRNHPEHAYLIAHGKQSPSETIRAACMGTGDGLRRPMEVSDPAFTSRRPSRLCGQPPTRSRPPIRALGCAQTVGRGRDQGTGLRIEARTCAAATRQRARVIPSGAVGASPWLDLAGSGSRWAAPTLTLASNPWQWRRLPRHLAQKNLCIRIEAG